MDWLQAFEGIFQPQVFLYLLVGVLSGALIGTLPGLTATMGVAVLTPISFWLEPACGFAMLIGVYNSAIWSGGISAILINTPGTPASMASTFDGYALSQKGLALLALNINTVFSVVGGLFSSLCLIFFAFPLAEFALRFGPAEYAVVAFFGLTMMVSVSGSSPVKGLLVGFLGLLFSTVGLDTIHAFKRYTLGSAQLLDGLSFVPVMIGLFGVGEILYQIYTTDHTFEQNITDVSRSKKFFLNFKELKRIFPFNLFSAVISVIIGAIPGAGGDIASIISWGQSKRMSKHPEEYGKGSLEGLSVSCVSNNAVIGGAMTTMLSLGIPGDAVTAILIGSLMMYGMNPGPRMFVENKPFILTLIAQLIVANILILIFGLTTSRIYPRILRIKKQTLWVVVIMCCILGSYAINNSYVDLIAMAVAGIFGFVLRKMHFPQGPLVLGMLLGKLLEANLRRTLAVTMGDYSIFFTSMICIVLLTISALSLAVPPVIQHIKAKKKNGGIAP
ncbi:MAG: tripartite tricarboxylate transporter permease [Spirochaetales bacterium]|jgi:putative tricarboxylic transport membrane protein|nr:tripartite tricarboxylate transporter permease [Spirochaetales bacterium]